MKQKLNSYVVEIVEVGPSREKEDADSQLDQDGESVATDDCLQRHTAVPLNHNNSLQSVIGTTI